MSQAKSLRSFEACSEECSLYEACTTMTSTLEKSDIGFAVRRISKNAAHTANLKLQVQAPDIVEATIEICDLDKELTQPLWECARARALGNCMSTETIVTELV